MFLSGKTLKYLNGLYRQPLITERSKIIEAFQKADLPIFESVIDFQETLGGVTERAGLEPLIFTVLPLNNPRDDYFTKIEAKEYKDVWRFRCVDTLYQMYFEIDQKGMMYEDGVLIAESANNYFGSLALEEEINSKKFKLGFRIYEPAAEIIGSLISRFDLTPDDEIFDNATKWFRSDSVCLQVRGKELFFFSRENLYQSVKELGVSRKNIPYLYWNWKIEFKESDYYSADRNKSFASELLDWVKYKFPI